jgi:hypothetical protein
MNTDIDIDINKVNITIDDHITKFNQIIKENRECYEKLQTINLLKEKIKDEQSQELIKINEQLKEKEKELLNKLQIIEKIQVIKELTIEEIEEKIILINNLLNNNFITNFLIEIYKQLSDYNLIIEKTLQLIKDLTEQTEQTEPYLLETKIYIYIKKLIYNFLNICIKIQNKNLKNYIAQIYKINEKIEQEEEENIIKIYKINEKIEEEEAKYIVKKYNTDVQIKENKLIVETEYFEVYCDYKEIIKEIKKFFINKDKDYFYNELKNNKEQFTEIKKLIDKFITKINNSSDKQMILTLPKDYKMIFYNFDNVERWINIFQNIEIKEENINIIEELFIKEKDLLSELKYIILKNKNEIIEELEKNINKIKKELEKNNLELEDKYEEEKTNLKQKYEEDKTNLENNKLKQVKEDYEYDKKKLEENYENDKKKLENKYIYNYHNHTNKYEYDNNKLKIYFNEELLKIIKLDDLEYKITNIIKIINYLDLECKKNSCDNKHILELLNKLLDIYVKEQQLKLKDIINEINNHKQELMEIPYIFNTPENYNKTQKINYIIFNIEIRKNIDIVINIINNIFYYNYENIFKQILIKDDFLIKKLFSNSDDIYILSELENNLKKIKDNINFLSDSESNISKYYKLYVENTEFIQEKQDIILKLIFNIKLIMINMKEKCLNKILKYKFDIIKNTLDEINKSNIYTHIIDLQINKIEQYFVFQISDKLKYIKLDENKIITLIEQLSLNKQLKELSRYFTEKNILKIDKFGKIFQIVQEMITIDNDYNNENMILIDLLDNFQAKKLWEIYLDIIKNFNNIINLYYLIINFYNDDKINNFPIEFKSFHFNSNIIKNIEQIIIYLKDNVDDKNFINIIKIYYIISKSVKYEIYRDREQINYIIDNDSLLIKFNNICDLLKTYFYISITDNFYLVKKNIEIIKKEIIREIIEKEKEKKLNYNNIEKYKKIINENIKNINKILYNDKENVKNLKKILDDIKIIDKIELPCSSKFFNTEENKIYCNLNNNLKNILIYLEKELNIKIDNLTDDDIYIH